MEAKLLDLILKFISSDTIERIKLQGNTEIIFKENIVNISKRFSEKSVITGKPKWIKYGIVAHGLENVRVDSRHNLIGLSLLLDGARRIKLSKSELIKVIKDNSLEPFKSLGLNFLERDERDQEIESMGFTANETDSFQYEIK